MLLEKVVIGSSVEAAYYALVNESYFIPTRKISPMFYEKLDVPILGTSNASEAWSKLNILLGLLSRRLFPGEQSPVRVSEDVIRMTKENISFKYEFQKTYIFDSSGLVIENEIAVPYPKTFVILDDFELSCLGPKRHVLEPIIGKTGLAKELHFYSSDRVDGSNFITDCVVESELTVDQINSFDYSDSMVRFIVERHLTSVGVHGRLMKYYKSGKPKYRKPKVVHVKRFLSEKDNNLYKDTEKVKLLNLSLREIIEQSTKR